MTTNELLEVEGGREGGREGRRKTYLLEVLISNDDFVAAHLLVQLLIIGQGGDAAGEEYPLPPNGGPAGGLMDDVALRGVREGGRRGRGETSW